MRLALLLLLFFVLACASSGPSNQNAATTPSQSGIAQGGSAQAETPISITARELFAAYKGNEVAADEKYKGKLLIVSGVVDSVGKDILGGMYVALQTGEMIFNVQCMFGEEHKAELAALKKGQKIAIKGRCDGKFGNVLLKESTIVPR